MKKYPKEIENQMKDFYESLSEKERRRYAGIEAIKRLLEEEKNSTIIIQENIKLYILNMKKC